MPEHDLLLVLGAGGHGKVVAESALAAGWRAVRFFDDRVPAGTRVCGWPVIGPLPAALAFTHGGDTESASDAHARRESGPMAGVVAIGDNSIRLAWVERLERAGLAVPTIIAPSATISPRATIGAGTVIIAGAIVAVDAVIGRAVIINTAASIDHECVVEQGVHISPGARIGGGVTIGARAWIGMGASIRHGIKIGPDAIVGIGAAVVHDVEPGTTVVGVPARPKNP